jgi:hypothetical protein
VGCPRQRGDAADLQRQGHLRIDVRCVRAQRRERHADEANAFPRRKLGREQLRADRRQGRAVQNRREAGSTAGDDLEVRELHFERHRSSPDASGSCMRRVSGAPAMAFEILVCHLHGRQDDLTRATEPPYLGMVPVVVSRSDARSLDPV